MMCSQSLRLLNGLSKEFICDRLFIESSNEINRDSIASENIKKVGKFNLLFDEAQDLNKKQKKPTNKVWK